MRWTTRATDDLTHIRDYTEERFGAAQARRAALAIYKDASSLKRMPHRGQHGRKPGTRELTVRALPFIVAYRVGEEPIEMLAHPLGLAAMALRLRLSSIDH